MAGVVGNRQVGLSVEFFKQAAAVFEESFAQPQFDGLGVAHPLLGHLLAGQSQEGFGFGESFVVDFLGLEFFLLPGAAASQRVI